MKVPGGALNLADLDGAVSEVLRLIATGWGLPGPKSSRGSIQRGSPGRTAAPAPRAGVTDVMSGMRHARCGRLHPALAPAAVNFGARLRRPAGAPQRGAGRLVAGSARETGRRRR